MKKAFSVLEALVVVAIFALLAGILYPAFQVAWKHQHHTIPAAGARP